MDIFDRLVQLEREAVEFGFKWETTEQILAQIRSEITEIEVHLQDQHQEKLREEIGDLLHAVFSLCVFCQLDPQMTLIHSIEKFARRFQMVKKLAMENGLSSLQGKSFSDLMYYWECSKKIVG